MQVLYRETTLGNNSNIKLGFLRNFWIGKLSNLNPKTVKGYYSADELNHL